MTKNDPVWTRILVALILFGLGAGVTLWSLATLLWPSEISPLRGLAGGVALLALAFGYVKLVGYLNGRADS